MADKEKSYLMDIQLSMVTDDDKKVKAIHIHQVNTESAPVYLWCDFLRRLAQMVPDGSVLFVGDGRKEIKPLVEKGKAYVITRNRDDLIANDYFEGVSDFELKHCRSGRVIKVNRYDMEDFICVGDYDPLMAMPISQECLEAIERIKKETEG